MRRWLISLVLCFATISLKAATPDPLDAAVKKLVADTDHWAYTQTTQLFDKKGQAEDGETIERYDPSKPENDQWVLFQYKGRVPTEDDRREWTRQKERVKRRSERPLGDIMNFEEATLEQETPENFVYRIPIKPGASRRMPSDKFYVLARVGRVRAEIEHLSVRATEPFRMTGMARVARVDKVDINAEFRVVDEQFAAQPYLIKASGSAKVAWLFRVGGGADVRWTDLKRVKPYSDRFDVKIGDVKALDF